LHDLIPLDPALPALGVLSEAEVDATMAFAANEKAQATRKAYASDWRDFAAWCAQRGATTLPVARQSGWWRATIRMGICDTAWRHHWRF